MRLINLLVASHAYMWKLVINTCLNCTLGYKAGNTYAAEAIMHSAVAVDVLPLLQLWTVRQAPA